MDLNGKIAIVTGAGRGIGRAIAEKMAEYGAKVVVADLAVDTVVRVADELTQDGHEAEAIAVDVTRASSVDRMVRGTVARFGQVDILGLQKEYIYIEFSKAISTLETKYCSPRFVQFYELYVVYTTERILASRHSTHIKAHKL